MATMTWPSPLPDAGMETYQTFNIGLYNPVTKRVELMQESKDNRPIRIRSREIN